ncbi:hypothetical protein PENSPDRAFT_759475 [Peniophora sp. CONT]|nr:hypothetical protein PENSPDRAFT_759475 [Peniophora sp. CONT]
MINTKCTHLPPKVIQLIFKQLREEWVPEREVVDPAEEITFRSGWMTFSQVCRAWREVALGPSLWAENTIDIFSIHPHHIPAILERSYPSHLAIEAISDDPFDKISQDVGLHAWLSTPVLQRVRRLSLEGERGLLDLFVSRLPTNMDQLRDLFITVNGADDIIILPALFANLDCITMLWLEHCEIPWDAPIYSAQITYLHFHGAGLGPKRTYTEFIDLIERLPHLRSLGLLNFVPVQDTTSRIIIVPSSFRFLEFIVTKEPILSDGLTFLSNLCAPPLCTRMIQLLNIPHTLASTSFFKSTLDQLLSRIFVDDAQCLPARQLEIHQDLVTVVYGDIRTQPVHLQRYEVARLQSTVENLIHLRSRDDKHNANLQCEVIALMPAAILQQLHRIMIFGSVIRAMQKMDGWAPLLGAVNVHHIDVGHDPFELASADCAALLDVLRQVKPRAEGGDSKICFPRLEVLVFRLSKEESDPEWINGVIDVVRVRKEQGAPLREVYISGYTAHWAVWDVIRDDVKVSLMPPVVVA